MDRRLAKIRRSYARPARYDSGMGLLERLVAHARREVGEAVRGRVLEVGIGTGRTLPWYAPGVELVGGDLTRAMLEGCAERALSLGREVALVEMDARRLPFGADRFDAVVFTLCLCTIPEPERALREALRVLRPGGSLWLLEHVRSHLPPIAWLQDAATVVTGRLSEEHFNRRTVETARAAGVEVLRVRRWAAGFFVLVEGRRPS